MRGLAGGLCILWVFLVFTPLEAATRDEAIALVTSTVIDTSSAKGALRGYCFQDPIAPGAVIAQDVIDTLGTAPDSSWFFWLDLQPEAYFAHPTVFLLVGVGSGSIDVLWHGEWWPTVDGVTPYLNRAVRDTTSDLFHAPPSPFAVLHPPPIETLGRLSRTRFPAATGDSICGIIICPYDTSKNASMAFDVQHATAMFQAFGVSNPKIVINQDRATTLGEIATLPTDCDKLYVYWVGHGDFVALSTPQGTTFESRRVTHEILAEAIAGRVAKETCMYLDACRSGIMNTHLFYACVDGFHIATTDPFTPTTGFKLPRNGVEGAWFTNFFTECVSAGLRGPRAFAWARERLQALKDSLAASPSADNWMEDIAGNNPEAVYIKTFGHIFNFEPIAGEPFCFEIPPGDSTGLITFPGGADSDTSGSFTLTCETVAGADTTWKKLGTYHWNLGKTISFRANTDPGGTGRYKMTAHSNKPFFKTIIRFRKEELGIYSTPQEKHNSASMGWRDGSGKEFNSSLGQGTFGFHTVDWIAETPFTSIPRNFGSGWYTGLETTFPLTPDPERPLLYTNQDPNSTYAQRTFLVVAFADIFDPGTGLPIDEAPLSLYGFQGATFFFSTLETVRRVPAGSEGTLHGITAAGDSVIQPIILDFGHILAEPVTLGMGVFDDVAFEFDAWIMLPEESMAGVVVGTPGGSAATLVSHLGPGYPNPFRSSTRIMFDLPFAASITLVVYDVQGRLVRTLLRGHRPEGIHTLVWDGRGDQGLPVGSGIYYYRLSGPGLRESRSVLRVR